MSSDRYDSLITRTLACIQMLKQDVISGKGHCYQRGRDNINWIAPGSYGYMVLKNASWENLTEPALAFPPATRRQIRETERQLGFDLPPLLRLLYERVGNGGFGPCYGITGCVGGFIESNERGQHVAGTYLTYKRWCPLIPLEDCQQMTIGSWNQLRQEQRLPSAAHYIRSDRLAYILPPEAWPEFLLHLNHYGCACHNWIDARNEVVYELYSPDGACWLLIQDSTFDLWLEDWLTKVEKAHGA